MGRKPPHDRTHQKSDASPRRSEKGAVKQRKAPPGQGGAFVFTDRSGKTHTLGRRGKEDDAAEKPAGGGGGKEFPTRKDAFARGERSESREARGGQEPRERGPKNKFEQRHQRGEKKRQSEWEPRGERKGRDRDRGGSGGGYREDRGGRSGGRDGGRRGGGRDGGFGGGRRDNGRGGGFRGGRDRDRPRPGPASGETLSLKATIDKNRKGFGFLIFESKAYEDAFLNPRDAERFFHGDRVEALIDTGSGEVLEIRVLQHRFREVVGRFYPIAGRPLVVYERKKAREEIPVTGEFLGAKARDWVKAKLSAGEDEGFSCEITKVYGQELPPAADLEMVAAEYNLTEEHSKESIREAEGFTLDVDSLDLVPVDQAGVPARRRDLREIPFITIDGETARDFDDAVFVERVDGGGHALWVAIADVSHYVKASTPLDAEAYGRATSVYFPERAFHMLPRALSENLCSLRPNEPRLSMVCRMEFDRDGKRARGKGIEVMNGLIYSRRRATYNEIQAESEAWAAKGSDPDWEYAPHMELYRRMRKARADRGSIDFDLPEAEVKVQPTGEPISILHRPRQDAHRLIEEFMIAANEAVTEWALEKKWPFIYRVHDEPSKKALMKFQEMCAHVGVNFQIDFDDVPGSLNRLVEEIQDHPAQNILNMGILRSMAQAHYSSVYGGHFGLASTAYTHFTSPIRRYPDLIVHRMLKMVLEKEEAGARLADSERERLEEKLAEMAEHCSYRERIASDAERESIKLKQVRIMLQHVGEEFDGKIMGMVEAGIFVGIPNPFIEGFVNKDELTDDSYEYVEERMCFVGRRKKKAFRIGDKVRIQVIRVDMDARTIDFRILDKDMAAREEVGVGVETGGGLPSDESAPGGGGPRGFSSTAGAGSGRGDGGGYRGGDRNRDRGGPGRGDGGNRGDRGGQNRGGDRDRGGGGGKGGFGGRRSKKRR